MSTAVAHQATFLLSTRVHPLYRVPLNTNGKTQLSPASTLHFVVLQIPNAVLVMISNLLKCTTLEHDMERMDYPSTVVVW